ncbi:MAG: protein-L-isoaspartate O-methyltransferase [Hyphomonadaceae bacterium]|nr:protein-L-isoaspartate O-methyltransferase [Hyphomonadaceae bacterium]
MRFVLEMRQAGVTDARILSALERTPREQYAPAHLSALALDDVALPLAHGQMMTKPSVIGRVLTALQPQERETILEVGTGSGFQAAVIASLAYKVVTLDRWSDLIADARGRFGMARLMRVFAHTADGAGGWEDDAPYDRIVLNAAVAELPDALLAQLKPDGVLLAPVGDADTQRLVRYRNGEREDLGPIKLAPLESGAVNPPAEESDDG